MIVDRNTTTRSNHPAPAWAEAWVAGELSPATQTTFAARLAEFTSSSLPIAAISTGVAPLALTASPPDDDLQRSFSARRSERTFAVEPMAATQFERLVWSLVRAPTGAFPYASAGGIRPVQVLAAMVNVQHPLDGRVVAIESLTSALIDLGACSPWTRLASAVGMFDPSARPAVVFVVACAFDAITAKYGERGGRFATIEAGHAVQNLVLRVAHDRLHAYELGGSADRALLHLLGVGGLGLDVASVVCIGNAPIETTERPIRRRWRR